MPQFHPGDRLAPEDAFFLYLEKAEMPLHIGNVSIFEGEVPLEAFIAHVESKLPSIPRYRQRIVVPPLNLGHPAWVDDPGFEIRRHIRSVHLKNGTDSDLRELAGQVFSEVMHSERPLWDVTLVGGLRRGRTAMIARVHHCLADGVAGSGLMRLILDDRPAAPHATEPVNPEYAAQSPDPAACIAEAFARLVSDALNGLITVQAATLNLAQAMVGNHAAASLEQWAGLAADMVESMERLPFNVPCRGPRRHLWIDFAERDFAAIRQACGGTLNDVVLTLVTAAVRKYTEHRAQTVQNRLLRIIVPVNLRAPGEAPGTGNRISFLPLIVPLDVRPPAELLAAIRERTQALKRSHVVELINLAAAWLGAMPAPVQALLGQLGNRVPIAPFHLVCTNVPGSRLPLYLLGRKMLRSYPYVPIGNEMGLCCAVQSYDGRLYFGLTTDSEGIPDADRVRDFVNEAFDELRAAASMVQRPTKEAPRRKPATRSRRRAPAPKTPLKSARDSEAMAVPMPPLPIEQETTVQAAAKPRRRRARPSLAENEPEPAIAEPSPETTSEAQSSPVPVEPPPITQEAPASASARPRRRRVRPSPAKSNPESPVQVAATVPSEVAAAQAAGAEAAEEGMAEPVLAR